MLSNFSFPYRCSFRPLWSKPILPSIHKHNINTNDLLKNESFEGLKDRFKKGFAKIYNMNELPSKNMLVNESEKWKPYRSIAAHYFWKITDDY